PLFIDELVRHKLVLGERAGKLRLEEALRARIERLDDGARQVLELVVVAGAPLTQETAAHAARLQFREVAQAASLPRAHNLVRTSGVRRTDAVEPYHDRVREAVLLGLAAANRKGWHERLAVALEALPHADPEALATHWRGAGEVDRAASYAQRAAAEAA